MTCAFCGSSATGKNVRSYTLKEGAALRFSRPDHLWPNRVLSEDGRTVTWTEDACSVHSTE